MGVKEGAKWELKKGWKWDWKKGGAKWVWVSRSRDLLRSKHLVSVFIPSAYINLSTKICWFMLLLKYQSRPCISITAWLVHFVHWMCQWGRYKKDISKQKYMEYIGDLVKYNLIMLTIIISLFLILYQVPIKSSVF